VAPAIQLVAEPQPAPLLNNVFDNRQPWRLFCKHPITDRL
jgi:hypothetical protein